MILLGKHKNGSKRLRVLPHDSPVWTQIPAGPVDVMVQHPHSRSLLPFGETFREARVLSIVAALFLNNPGGGWVESVVTVATQRLPAYCSHFTTFAVDGAWRWFQKRRAKRG